MQQPQLELWSAEPHPTPPIYQQLTPPASGRRNALATRLQNAAKAAENGHTDAALSLILSVRERADGNPDPQDWVMDSAAQDQLLGYLDELIAAVKAS